MVQTVFFVIVLFLMFNYLSFDFVDTLLKGPRLKNKLRIIVGLVNALIVSTYTLLGVNSFFNAYILLSVIFFVEFIIFYKEKKACSLFCMFTFVIHIITIHSLCISVYAVVTQHTLYDIMNHPFSLALSTCITLMVLNIVFLTVKRLVPSKSVRIINQHDTQLGFMNAWLSVFYIYLIINALVYSAPNSQPTLIINQIIAPISILIGTYIILFFSIKMGELLGYKEKTAELQCTIDTERQYRTTIDKDVFRVIEINFNKNELLSGFEEFEEQLGNTIHNYSDMLNFMIQTSVHPDDRTEFIKYKSPDNAIKAYEEGLTDISFDYRRLMPDGNYVWMRVLMAMTRDSQSSDLRGFAQIKNIDTEKRQQLELQYKAERDLLTSLYNKGTTEMLIASKLSADKGSTHCGVLFIIDIDNFKMINDRLGHLYGDAVLSELSVGLRNVFRDCDIVGRIGGDEFLVFAEGLQSEAIIIEKAQRICNAFSQTYTNENDEGYHVSSSVGIAIFPKDGDDFATLYKCADIALYATKEKGKNSYSFYEKTIKTPYLSAKTEIDTHGVVQKSFKDNRIEYVFRLLYGSEDSKSAIESVLELIAKNFGFSRANIFEFNELSTHFNGVFEWCASGIDSVSSNYIDMPVSSFDFVVSALGKSGGMFLAVPTDFPEYAQESYTSIGIKSIVHFSILERDKLIGVIAFQNCMGDNFELSDTAFEELRTICQVLSVFMAKRLSNERELQHHRAIESVMDNMNSIAYVIDRETYQVYYENQNTINITTHPSIGVKCHMAYRGFDAPCDDCPLAYLSDEHTSCTVELYTEKFDIYTKTSAALIDWSNDRKAMLISSIDVTEYKRPKS